MSPKNYSDEELVAIADEACSEAWQIVNSTTGWKEVKKNSKAVVVSKKNDKGKKIYKVTAKFDIPAEKLAKRLENVDTLAEWNTTLDLFEVLKRPSDSVVLSYQVTAEGGGASKIVSARDFIYVFKTVYKEEQGKKIFFQGGKSVDYPKKAAKSNLVRAWNGPGGQMVKPIDDEHCEFVWLLDCDYKGWIPSHILEIAMPIAQMQFVDCVEKLVNQLKDA